VDEWNIQWNNIIIIKNKILPVSPTWMKLEDAHILLCERSQVQTQECHPISPACGIKRKGGREEGKRK
jgi:hypothetical protein